MPESYPTFRAGQKVTGELLSSALPRTARKISDTTYTTTSVVSDPELTLEVEANAVYMMEGTIYTSHTVPNSDLVIDWDAPSGTDGTWSGTGRAVDTAGVDSGDAKMIGTAITASRSFGTDDGGSGTPTATLVTATVIVGSTAGSYTAQFGMLTASGTLTVFTDSFITLRRIA